MIVRSRHHLDLSQTDAETETQNRVTQILRCRRCHARTTAAIRPYAVRAQAKSYRSARAQRRLPLLAPTAWRVKACRPGAVRSNLRAMLPQTRSQSA